MRKTNPPLSGRLDDPNLLSLVQDVAGKAISREEAMGRRYFIADAAKDIVQDLYLILPQEISAYNPTVGVPLRKYLAQRITWRVRKMIRDERRWRRITDPHTDDTVVRGESAGARVIGGSGRGSERSPMRAAVTSRWNELADMSADLLDPAWYSLNPEDRVILRCYYGMEMSQAEIAQGVGLSQGQVSRRAVAALKKLRDAMHKNGPPRTC